MVEGKRGDSRDVSFCLVICWDLCKFHAELQLENRPQIGMSEEMALKRCKEFYNNLMK